VLTWGFEDVGIAVESVGCVKVPSLESSVGWYQLPAPPRPMCAYSEGAWEVAWVGCGVVDGARLASMSFGDVRELYHDSDARMVSCSP